MEEEDKAQVTRVTASQNGDAATFRLSGGAVLSLMPVPGRHVPRFENLIYSERSVVLAQLTSLGHQGRRPWVACQT
jgi:hypothetical protein